MFAEQDLYELKEEGHRKGYKDDHAIFKNMADIVRAYEAVYPSLPDGRRARFHHSWVNKRIASGSQSANNTPHTTKFTSTPAESNGASHAHGGTTHPPGNSLERKKATIISNLTNVHSKQAKEKR